MAKCLVDLMTQGTFTGHMPAVDAPGAREC